MGADTASQVPVQGSGQASGLLPICKYVERSGDRKACCLPLHARSHKRGFIAVACMANHQWVWCEACCDCNGGGSGCANPLHWMERDSFDTGKVSLFCPKFAIFVFFSWIRWFVLSTGIQKSSLRTVPHVQLGRQCHLHHVQGAYAPTSFLSSALVMSSIWTSKERGQSICPFLTMLG